MSKYITYTWKFHTYSIKGKSKCKICGKTITKSFSTEFREDSVPDTESVKAEKAKWESEEHICTKCLKDSLVAPQESYELDVSQGWDLIKQQEEFNKTRMNYIKSLNDKLKDTIVRWNGKEYVVNYISDYNYKPADIHIELKQIDTRMPWCTTEKSVFTSIGGYHWSNNPDFKDIEFTKENFKDRQARINEFYEEHDV